MKSLETLRKVIGSLAQADSDAPLHDAAVELVDELDRELTGEEYEEGDKVVDLTDKLVAELKDFNESSNEEDDDIELDEEDEEEEDDDEFEGIEEEDDEEK